MEGCLLDVCSALCVGAKSVAVTVTAQGTCSYRGTIGIFIVKFRDWAFVVLDHQSALANGVSHHQTALPGAGLRGSYPSLWLLLCLRLHLGALLMFPAQGWRLPTGEWNKGQESLNLPQEFPVRDWRTPQRCQVPVVTRFTAYPLTLLEGLSLLHHGCQQTWVLCWCWWLVTS